MTADRKDREWLQRKLVALLEDASTAEEPDHQACSAYAALLFKMLPAAEGGKDLGWLDEAREAVRGNRGSERATGPEKP